MSIQDRALLVTFSAGIGSSFKVKDRKTAKEVSQDKKAKESRVHVSKSLLPEDALEKIKAALEEAHDFHNSLTSPWARSGADILKAEDFMKHSDGMRARKRKVDAAWEDFLDVYADHCETAKKELGELYSAKDFPPVEKVAKGFYWEVKVLPIGNDFSNDFRIHLQEDEAQVLRDTVTADLRATVFKPFFGTEDTPGPLVAMVRRLSDPDAKFKNSLVGNLREMIHLIPGGDPIVDHLAKQLEDIAKYDAETLREHPGIRATTAARANEILSAMSDYLPCTETAGALRVAEADAVAMAADKVIQAEHHAALDLGYDYAPGEPVNGGAPIPDPLPEPEPADPQFRPIVSFQPVIVPDPVPTVPESTPTVPSWRKRMLRTAVAATANLL